MSFSRIKASGWVLNEKLTSAQMNQLDIDHSNAVDKTGDTITGTISLNSSSAIISVTNDGLIQIGSGGFFTANSGSLNSFNNCNVSLNSGSQLNLHTSSDATFDSGCTLTCNGSATFNDLVSFGNASTITVSGTLSGAVGSSWTLAGPISMANATISGTARLKVASRSVLRTFGIGFTGYTGTTPYFKAQQGIALQNSVAAGNEMSIELTHLPHNSVLTALSVFYRPSAGHGGLPAQPSIIIYSQDITSGVTASLGTITDTAASVGIYETVRTLTVSGLSETIDRTQYKYFVRFFGEWAANSQTGLSFYGGRTLSTITEYDEG